MKTLSKQPGFRQSDRSLKHTGVYTDGADCESQLHRPAQNKEFVNQELNVSENNWEWIRVTVGIDKDQTQDCSMRYGKCHILGELYDSKLLTPDSILS